MPWSIKQRDGRFCVVKDDDGATVHCHGTEAEAKAQVRALYAGARRSGELKAADDEAPAPGAAEVVVIDGYAAKAIDGDEPGRFGGYLARWGGPDRPDATAARDYFTPESDLGRFAAGDLDVLFHHSLPHVKGKPNELADAVIGTARIVPDSEGLWLSGRLDLAVPGVKALWDGLAADDDGFGLSSGAVSHTVRRVKQPNGTHWLKRWWVVEASITPEPGERRTAAVALKSLLDGPDAASQGIEPSEAPAAAPATFLDALQADADSGLLAAASRFVKASDAKLAAIKAHRDSWDAQYHRLRGTTPAAIEAREREMAEAVARFERYFA